MVERILITTRSQIDADFESIGLPGQGFGDEQLQNLIGLFFIFAGVIAVIVIIIAGWKYVLSGADPQKTKSAKDTILWAVIGLVVSVSAWIIVDVILG